MLLVVLVLLISLWTPVLLVPVVALPVKVFAGWD